MKALFAVAVAILVLFGVAPAARAAPCSFSNPSACGSPGINQIAVANGGVLNGTFTGSPTFSGSVTFSGPLTLSGLSSSAQVSCVGLNSSNQVVLAAGACASSFGGVTGPGTTVNGYVPQWNGVTGTALLAGIPVGPTGLNTILETGGGGLIASSVVPAINLAASGAGGVTGILGPSNGGTGENNGANTFTTSLPLIITGSGTQTFFFGNSGVPWTYNFPQVSGNLGYQVGSLVSGHCLQASGTAGGYSDAGAACGAGGGGNVSNSGTPAAGQIASWVSTTTIQGNTTGTGVITALGVNVGTNGAFVVLGGALGTPSSGVGTNLTGTAAGMTAGVATVANGLKTATTTVVVSSATAPTNGQVLQATSSTAAGWATVSSSGTLTGLTQGTPDVLFNGTTTCTSGSCAVSTQVPLSAQTGTYAVQNSDNTQVITGATALTIVPPGTGGNFLPGYGASVLGASGGSTFTPSGGSLAGGLAVISLTQNQFMSFAVDGANYDVALGLPPSGTQNLVLATPNGSTGQPKLRALVAADLPSGVTSTIASGTSALGTSAISSAACATVVTTTATGVATTDVLTWGFNGDPTGVTGYTPVTTGALTIFAYPSSGNANFKVCNLTSASVTPGAITLNWRVVR